MRMHRRQQAGRYHDKYMVLVELDALALTVFTPGSLSHGINTRLCDVSFLTLGCTTGPSLSSTVNGL